MKQVRLALPNGAEEMMVIKSELICLGQP